MSAPPRTESERRDETCLAAVVEGDRHALAEIYDRHASAVLRVALRFLPCRHDAEDLVHDVFVEAWSKAADYDPTRGTARRWLLMRARSRAIDRLRALETARRHAMQQQRDADPSPLATLPHWEPGDRARARRALQELPPAQRTVIELSYFEGLTCAELAERCEIPIGTVKSRLSAALSKLRRSLASPLGAP